MNMNKIQTFNDFCEFNCDRLYDPKFDFNSQCTGYKLLYKLVKNNITPASLEEIERWENNPTSEELLSTPDIKYLRFLHILLRPYIINNWDYIKTLELINYD